MVWGLEPGESIRRKDLHDEYGGKRQGGISPSNSTPNVMVFTDPETGHQHGYLDRWEEGILHYTGEGQTGPQVLAHGNLQILNHDAAGRALRVFEGSSGEVTYVGRFELDDPPYYTARAPESGNSGKLRSVIMFRLRPIDEGAGIGTSPERVQRGHRAVAPETESAEQALAQLAGDGSIKRQRFLHDGPTRRAIELRGMTVATEHFEAEGWLVKDVSATASYDLEATSAAIEKHIEVKGTTSLGQEVLLTPNEVKHARTYPDVALTIVHSITVTPTDAGPVAEGGELVLYDPWDITQGNLSPVGYAYSVPGGSS
jgi:hypothetical protein